MKNIITILFLSLTLSLYVYGQEKQNGNHSGNLSGNNPRHELQDKDFRELLRSHSMQKHASGINPAILKSSAGDAPGWSWAVNFGGSGGANGIDIDYDVNNNAYIIGTFNGSLSFGSSVLNSSGLWDAFVAKFNSAGDLIWLKQISANTNQCCEGKGIAVDGAGNIYIAGDFNGTIHLGSNSLTTSGDYDAYIAKYDNSGNLLWYNKYGSSSAESVIGIVSDPAGNVYLGGNADKQFLVKFNPLGQYQWKTNSNSVLTGMAYGANGIYLTGSLSGPGYFGTIFIDPGVNVPVTFTSKQDSSGTFLWATYVRNEDDNSSSNATSIVVDSLGNAYESGWFYGSIVFLPDSVVLTVTFGINNFITKYDSNGRCKWAIRSTNNFSDYSCFVSADQNNNVYACGQFDQNYTFGNSSLVGQGYYLEKLTGNGTPLWAKNQDLAPTGCSVNRNNQILEVGHKDYNLALSSHDLEGQLQWTKIDTTDCGYSVGYYANDVDSLGNSYLHGFYSGKNKFQNTTLRGNGFYTTKVRSDNTVAWVSSMEQLTTTPNLSSSGIAVNKNLDTYVWGTLTDSLKVGGTLLVNPVNENFMGYLVKYNINGDFQWVRSFYSSASITGTGAIATDIRNNVIIGGQYSNDLTIGSFTFQTSYSLTSFFAKYSPAGDLLFAKSFDITSHSMSIWVRSVATDPQGNIYLAGQFTGTVNFGTTSLTSIGSKDIFIAKYDANGNELWAKRAGGNNYDRASAVTTDGNGNAYITGYFYSTSVSFDNITINSPYSNGTNQYVAKYNTDGSALWARAIQSNSFTWPAYKIGTDKMGNCYIGGDYEDSLRFDNGPLLTGVYGYYVAKYTSNGDFDWCQNLTGINYSSGLFSINPLSDKSVYVSGIIDNDVIPLGACNLASANTNTFIALMGEVVGIQYLPCGSKEMEAFPNPAKGRLFLKFTDQPDPVVIYTLSDQSGKKILTHQTEGEKLITIDLPDLPSGMYFVSVTTKNGVFTKKIIVE